MIVVSVERVGVAPTLPRLVTVVGARLSYFALQEVVHMYYTLSLSLKSRDSWLS